MHVTTLPLITINPNPQRQEFDPDALQELKNSVEDTGLMHAPVVREEDGKLVLVAGERRLRAIEEIYALGGSFTHNGQLFTDGAVPYVTLGELSVLEAEEAELDENLRRRDLTWQEHAVAISRLHALRVQQRQKGYLEERQQFDKNPGREEAPVYQPHTVADTAEELTGRSDGAFQDNIRKELIVAKHLDNPAVMKAKSADEAFKILKKQEEQRRNIALATELGHTFNSSSHTLLNMNCLDFMQDVKNHGRFDVILTDPPYGMGAQDFGDAGGRMAGIEHHYDDSFEAWNKLMTDWTRLSFHITKPQAHAYIFCDIDNFHTLKGMMIAAGWYVFRTPMIVHKLNSGRVPLPDQGPRRQWECLLYAIKGKKPVTHIYPDVVAVSGDENMSHGAQKPVALYQNLLQRSVRPGDEVIDTFAGTGPIFPAAHTYKCKATGIEMNPEYYSMSAKRIDSLTAEDAGTAFLGE